MASTQFKKVGTWKRRFKEYRRLMKIKNITQKRKTIRKKKEKI
jgi:hypothetical protein